MKVGIAGAGFMGEIHAQNYLKLECVELYALAEKNPAKIKKFNNSFTPKKIYNNIFEMIDDDNIEIIDVCLPTPLHAPAAVAALNKNKHVLLEKPIALNIIDAVLIKEAAEKSKGKFMVAHVLRFWPEYKMMHQIIKENLLDEGIVEVYASRFNELPLWSEGTWIMDEEHSGGLIIDLMIHDIDFIIWNLGKVNSVFCHAIYDHNNFATQVMAILEMKNGACAYIEGGYLNPRDAGLSSQMRIYSKNSLLEMYSHNKTLTLTQNCKSSKEIKVYGEDGYFAEINYFINCIKHSRKPEVITTDNAIESLITCLELKKSLKEKKWISLNNSLSNK